MIGIMVFIMATSTMVSGILQANRLAKRVNEEFIVGQQKDGLSIARDLVTRQERAENILQIAKNFISENDTDFMNSQTYISTLSQSDQKRELFEANENLQISVDCIYTRLMEYGMSEKDERALNEEKSVFDEAMDAIQSDPYNTLVQEYEKETDTIPGNFFKRFSKKVESFS